MWFQILGISYFYILDWLERITFLANLGGFSGIIKKKVHIFVLYTHFIILKISQKLQCFTTNICSYSLMKMCSIIYNFFNLN
jgi:hypothetical protein